MSILVLCGFGSMSIFLGGLTILDSYSFRRLVEPTVLILSHQALKKDPLGLFTDLAETRGFEPPRRVSAYTISRYATVPCRHSYYR